jgi:predicted secreted protein
MKRMLGKLLILWGVLQVFSCSTPTSTTMAKNAMMQIDHSYHNQDLQIRVGDTLQISLDEIPTTGYIWVLVTEKPAFLSLLSDNFLHPGHGTTAVAGAGGKRQLVYKALQKGEGFLSFVKRRPWEGGEISDERFTISVKAE